MVAEASTRIIDIIVAHRVMAVLLRARLDAGVPATLMLRHGRRGQGEGNPAAALRSIDHLRGADGDVAVMHLGHPAGQSEPETEAPRGSTWRPRPVHLVEGGEHALALFLRNARALVAHRELDRAV